MALPTSREMTFGWQSIVPSVVLNAIQDAIIGMNTAVGVINATIADIPAALAAAVAAIGVVEDDVALLKGVRTRTFPAYGKWVAAADGVFDAGNWISGMHIRDSRGHIRLEGNYGGIPFYFIPVEVRQGDKISVTLRVQQSVSEAGAMSAKLSHAYGGEAMTDVTPVNGSTAAGTGVQELVLSNEHVVVANHFYFIVATNVNGAEMTRDYLSVTVAEQAA